MLPTLNQMGGRTLTQMKNSCRLNGGAIAGTVIGVIAIIVSCVYYSILRRTRDPLSEDEMEEV